MKGDERNLKVSFDLKNYMMSCMDELNNICILMIYRKIVVFIMLISFCLFLVYIIMIICQND